MNVDLIDFMGGDASVVRAARVSTLGSESKAEENSGLINYLVRERHASPFEHNVFTFYVRAPIFVAREFMRHRMASYNEESGRYKVLETEFYYPVATDRPLVQIGKTGDYEFEDVTDPTFRESVLDLMDEAYGPAEEVYHKLLSMGVAKEVARMVLPVGTYSSWYVTINARSLMNFLSLRTASNAQWEIREVAREMEQHFAREMPITYNAWVQNGRESI